MYISILALFYKKLVIFKVIASRMLQYQISVLFYNIFMLVANSKNFVWNSIEPIYTIRRICKYYIKSFCAYLEEIEGIVPYHLHSFYLESGGALFDESGMEMIHFDTYYICTAA